MVRVFSILVDPLGPLAGQRLDTHEFVKFIQKSGGKVFGPVDAGSAKGAQIGKVTAEQLGQFYKGILQNNVLTIQVSSAIQKPQAVSLSLTDSARQQLKKPQIFFPHEIGPCSNADMSR